MEKIDTIIGFLSAFKEGKTVQYKVPDKGIWLNVENIKELISQIYFGHELRIAKMPKYRPYKNAEEFLKAIKEHGPYIHVVGSLQNQFEIFPTVTDLGVSDCSSVFLSFEYLLNHKSIWSDGTLCGILE